MLITLADGCMRHCASSQLFGVNARSTAPFGWFLAVWRSDLLC
jgi:hypothetical protein